MTHLSRDEVERHLALLLETTRFRQARLQAEALRLFVEACLRGESLSTRELARGIYGREDDKFVRATRQLTREIRAKLGLIHAELPPGSIEFRLHETRPELIVRIPESATTPTLISTDRDSRRSRRRRIGFGVAAILAAISALGVWLVQASKGVPFRVDATTLGLQIHDRRGDRLNAWEHSLTAKVFEQIRIEDYDLREWLAGAVLERDRWPHIRVAFLNALPPRPYDTRLRLFGRRRNLLGELRLPWLPDAAQDGPVLTEQGGAAFQGHYKVFSISPIEFDGNPEREEILVSIADNAAFPCQILVLGFDGDWSVEMAYWNMGQAFAKSIGDLDGDGREEVAVYGQNNSYLRPFLTLLSRPEDTRPWIGRSPDGDRRAGIVELEGLPPIGVTLILPRSDLAVPEFPDLYRLRAISSELSRDEDRRVLHVRVQDGAGRPRQAALEMEFELDLDQGTAQFAMKDYFDYLELIKIRIGAAELEDRWKILETNRLEDYEKDIASRILYWDDRQPRAAWQPFEMEALRQRFVSPRDSD